VRTMSDLDIDLDLVTEDADDCYVCGKEAVGYIEYTDSCCDWPNPAPLCETCYEMAKHHLEFWGPLDWVCPKCNTGVDVVAIYRRHSH
jgi:hypothetical protein